MHSNTFTLYLIHELYPLSFCVKYQNQAITLYSQGFTILILIIVFNLNFNILMSVEYTCKNN